MIEILQNNAKTPKITSLNYLQRIANESKTKPDIIKIEPKHVGSKKMVDEILSNWKSKQFLK